MHDEDTTTYLGPSISAELTDDIAVGMSLYYFFRDKKVQSNQYLSDSSDEISQWQTVDQFVSVHGVLPIIGVMWTPADEWSVGATFRMQSSFSSTIDQNVINYAGDGSDQATMSSSSSDYTVDYPMQFSVGVAYFPSPFLLISSDVDVYYFLDSTLDHVVNVSVGAEYFLTQRQAIRAGFFTNNSNVPAPTSSSTNRRSIDLMGLSCGYSMYSASNSLTVGLVFAAGNGEAQVYSNDSTIIDFTQTDVSVLVSAGWIVFTANYVIVYKRVFHKLYP